VSSRRIVWQQPVGGTLDRQGEVTEVQRAAGERTLIASDVTCDGIAGFQDVEIQKILPRRGQFQH
jgi:hypothetical protein